MKIRAAVLYRTNEPLVVEEIEIPELREGQVLVHMAFSGLCHSQINEIRGLKGDDKFLPHTLGHEGSGIVEAVGAGVKKTKPGQHVVATWIQGSGLNAPSTAYKKVSDGKVVNSGAISTFMEYAVISENRLVPITDDMSLREAALLGCAIPTGAGIIFNCASGMSLNNIAVFGAGGIGLSAVIAAHCQGVQQIIAVDVTEAKLQQAISLGATHAINAKQVDSIAEILRIIVGTWGGNTDPDRDIPMYAAKYLAGQMKLKELITDEYSLDEINAACADLEQQRVGRAIIGFATQ